MAGEALEKEPAEGQDPTGEDMTTAILRHSGDSGTLTITPSCAIDEIVAGMSPENSHELLDAGERGAERVEW